MKKRIVKERVENGKIICDNCGWSWKISDGGDDLYVCHKCGFNNEQKTSNFDRTIDMLTRDMSIDGYDSQVDSIKRFVKDFIIKNGYKLKFLQYCGSRQFHGVRTKNTIIICSVGEFGSLGDFLYVIFHEIRHEQQLSEIKIPNPLNDENFSNIEETLSNLKELELDADQYAKNVINKIITHTRIPQSEAKKYFKVSKFIEDYPLLSKMIESNYLMTINQIKMMRKSGIPFEDIQDLPMIKDNLNLLQDFI